MRSSILLAVALSAVVASACDDDGISGPGAKEPVSLDFCAGDFPIWFAVQNETEAWDEISGNASGTFTFEATPRVSIAYVTSFGGDFSTQVLNVTREELQGIAGETCVESGTKSLGGSVTGLTGQQVGRLSMASEVDAVSVSNPTYSFSNLPAGPLDLVATRFATSTTQPPDRIIVRRNLDLQNGATIPALDFGSSEAQPLAQANVTLANRGSDFVSVTTEYLSANGTTHQLMQFSGTNANASLFVSVPESMRGADDIHLLTVFASAAAGLREVSQYYRNPSDRTFTFGPQLSVPTVSLVATTPYRRPRLGVASQTEYDDAMEAFFGQLSGTTFRSVRIFTSAAFLGGRPSTWELELPDMTAAGYQPTWSFAAGSDINASARGLDGNVNVILGAAPDNGDMIRSAIRDAAVVMALRALRSNAGPFRTVLLRRAPE